MLLLCDVKYFYLKLHVYDKENLQEANTKLTVCFVCYSESTNIIEKANKELEEVQFFD